MAALRSMNDVLQSTLASLPSSTTSCGGGRDALLEALGSGWIIPVLHDAGDGAVHGIWVVLDRLPPSRGTTGTQFEIIFRGMVTALAWLHQEIRRRHHHHHAVTVWVDARFVSLVSMEVILKRQLVEATVAGLRAVPQQDHVWGLGTSIEVIVMHRDVDVLAAPLLRAAVDNIVASCLLPSTAAPVVRYVSVPSATLLHHQSCVAQLPIATARATEALLSDDGSWFVAWWEALLAASVDGLSDVGSATPLLSSPPRRSRSRESSEGGNDACASAVQSPGLRRWCQLLQTALEQDLPLREAIVDEEAREALRLQFWSLHELQCIGSHLSPPRASTLYQCAVALGNGEARERCRICHDETHARRDLIDMRMACEELVVAAALEQHKLRGEEAAARRIVAAQERRLRELLVALREEPDNASNGFIPSAMIPHVASLLLFGWSKAHQPSDSSIISVAPDDDVEGGGGSTPTPSSEVPHLDVTTAYESMQCVENAVLLTDMSSQTPSPVLPAPRISRLSYPLKRSLVEDCALRTTGAVSSPPSSSPLRKKMGSLTSASPNGDDSPCRRDVVDVACGSDVPVMCELQRQHPCAASPVQPATRTEDF